MFKIVKQSQEAIVERVGKYDRTLKSGFSIVIPIIDRVGKVIDLRTQIIDSAPQDIITKDNVTMVVDSVAFYHITDSFKATYEISDLQQGIKQLITTTLRDICGSMTLDETLTSRDKINNKLRIILDEATDKWGVKVERVEIKDIKLPKDLEQAIQKEMRAEREKREKILIAEATKASAITEAEGLKESQILKAEAEKEAKIRQAEGEATAKLEVAKAEAESLTMVFKALKEANVDENMLSLKYVEALTEMAKGDNKVFVPYESKGLLGNLGAIKELMK